MSILVRIVTMCFFLSTAIWSKGFSLDATVGALSPTNSIASANLDFSAHLWYKFDQMVFFGVGSGIQSMDDERHFPLLGSLWVRIPFGGQILPVATGDIGYSLGDSPQFLWKAGGGLDIKNGDYSSLLIMAGYQSFQQLGGHFYLRGGLLLEF